METPGNTKGLHSKDCSWERGADLPRQGSSRPGSPVGASGAPSGAPPVSWAMGLVHRSLGRGGHFVAPLPTGCLGCASGPGGRKQRDASLPQWRAPGLGLCVGAGAHTRVLGTPSRGLVHCGGWAPEAVPVSPAQGRCLSLRSVHAPGRSWGAVWDCGHRAPEGGPCLQSWYDPGVHAHLCPHQPRQLQPLSQVTTAREQKPCLSKDFLFIFII